MNNEFQGNQHKAIIAAGDSMSEEFLKSCESICTLTEMKPRFLHASQIHIGSSAYFGDTYIGMQSYHLKSSLQKLEEEESQHQLNEELKNFPKSIEYETCILTGDVASIVNADAQMNKASLVICSAQQDSYKNMMEGFSTSLQILNGSHTPVLVLPNNAGTASFKKGMTIIIADDLHDTPLNTLTGACKFAAGIGDVKIIHAHITQEEKSLKKYINRLKTAMNLSQIPFDPELSEDKAIENFENDLRNKMQKRAEQSMKLLEETGCSYEAKIISGDVGSSISKLSQEVSADMLVFGRHLTLHRKPFGIGKLPFRAMIEMKVPVMMFPPIENNGA